MKTLPQKEETVILRTTKVQKNQLKRMANLEQKSLTEFILDATLSPKIDKTKAEILVYLNQNLEEITRSQKNIIQLLLTAATEELPINKDNMLEFYNNMLKEGSER